MRSRWIGILSAGALTLALACNGTDADLNQRVLLRLSKEPTPAEQLSISTHQRVVRLKGVVHTSAERERLERATREVDGVAAVENLLVVDAPVELTGENIPSKSAYDISSMNKPEDAILGENIRRRLDAQALDDIAVDVKDGVVTLRGNVDQRVHDAAIQIAMDTHADIDDRLSIVRPGSSAY